MTIQELEESGVWPHILKRIKEVVQPGDTIEKYNNIEFLSGSAGYQIVRNGEVVAQFATMMS